MSDLDGWSISQALVEHEDSYDQWLASKGVTSGRAKMKAEINRLRTELAEQARLNGMGSEREAEAYRRGVEDAAKVADGVAAEKDVLATGTPDDVDFVVYRQSAETAESIAAAIRSLPALDKEGA